MWHKYGISWRLVRSSGALLRQHGDLLLIPMITVIIVSITLVGMVGGTLLLLGLDMERFVQAPAWVHTLLTFLYYIVSYAIGIYANTALITVAVGVFRGEPMELGAGWRMATARLPSIIGYAIVMATVGMAIRYIFRPIGVFGKLLGPTVQRFIVFSALGLAWHVVPYFVAPIMIYEEARPLHAMRRSTQLIHERWGQDVVVNASVWLIFAVPLMLVAIVAGPAMVWAISTLNEWVVTVVLYGLVMLLLLTMIFKMAMDSIFSAAAYVYAARGEVVREFHLEDLRDAFGNRPSRIANLARRAGNRIAPAVRRIPVPRRGKGTAVPQTAEGTAAAVLATSTADDAPIIAPESPLDAASIADASTVAPADGQTPASTAER